MKAKFPLQNLMGAHIHPELYTADIKGPMKAVGGKHNVELRRVTH